MRTFLILWKSVQWLFWHTNHIYSLQFHSTVEIPTGVFLRLNMGPSHSFRTTGSDPSPQSNIANLLKTQNASLCPTYSINAWHAVSKCAQAHSENQHTLHFIIHEVTIRQSSLSSSFFIDRRSLACFSWTAYNNINPVKQSFKLLHNWEVLYVQPRSQKSWDAV